MKTKTSPRVLLLTDAYPPEIRSCPTLMRDLAIGLSERGYRVSVLTTYPTYNLTPNDRKRFENVLGNIVRYEEGIKVVRVPVPPLHNVGPFIKGVSELALPVVVSAAGAFSGPFDAIITFSPPLTLGIAAAALKARFRCKVVLNVQDLMPQAAIDLGVLKNRALIHAFEVIEELCYRGADRITCHSEGNVEWMRRNRPSHASKIEVVHNWVDVASYRDAGPDPSIRRELGLEGKFVFMFGGVMGFAQDLATVIEAARRLESREDLAFLLVGHGIARKDLEFRASGLRNVVFHPFVGPDRYVEWLKTMDAGLVTLKAEARTPVVPSKMLGFMAAGIPYLALVGPGSDARTITEKAGSGVLVAPGDVGGLAAAAAGLARDPDGARAMGKKGLEYCLGHFDRDSCIDRYDRILRDLIPGCFHSA